MKVMIAIPHQKWIAAEILPRFAEIIGHATELGYDLSLFMHMACPHDASRNGIAHHFLKSDCDWLLSLDDDILPPANILSIIDDARPVVAAWACGLTQTDRSGELTFAVSPVALQKVDSDKYAPFPVKKGEVVEVPYFGTGCFAVKKEVFQNVPAPWFQFELYPDGTLKTGEDIKFCANVREHGYVPHYDGRFVCQHLKELWIY